MAPKTIDINTGGELFKDVDPIGLLTDASARRYMHELKGRIRERFPNARIFVRWGPSLDSGPDVYTIPRAETAEEKVVELADEVREDPDSWVVYDDAVRDALAL